MKRCVFLLYIAKNQIFVYNNARIERKGNRRLNYEDRKRIEKMKEQGARVIVIADTIGVHRATIYNELKRGGTPYRAEVAQRTV